MMRLHDVMQQPALNAQRTLGMTLWHWGILAVMAIVLVIVWVIVRHRDSFRHGLARQKTAVLAVALAGVIGTFGLMVNAVEAIHFVQFGGLTVLLSIAYGRVWPALLTSVVLGVADEWYQLYVLHSGWQPYLDFNDLVLNTIGATGGAVIARIRMPMGNFRFWLGVWAACWIMASCAVLFGPISIYPSEESFVLNRWNYPDRQSFSARWTSTAWGNHWFKLSWIEGFLLTAFLPYLIARGQDNQTNPKAE